jgi:hypothetical protein
MQSFETELNSVNSDQKIAAMSPDTKLLSLFFHELNIALKNATTYPGQHPIINASKLKVVATLDRLLSSQDELCVIISRNTLLVGRHSLDPANPVFRNLAENLYDKGIATVVFKRGLDGDGLDVLREILDLDRKLSWQEGVIEKILAGNRASHLHVERLDYGSLYTKEGNEFCLLDKETIRAETIGLWEHFVHRILTGKQEMPVPPADFSTSCQPDNLATALNNLSNEAATTSADNYADAVNYLVSHMREEVGLEVRTEIITKLTTLVRTMTPQLRRRFLSCLCNSLKVSEDLTAEIFDGFPNEIILKTLTDIVVDGDNPPSHIQLLLAGLPKKPFSTEKAFPASTSGDINREEFDALHTISREDNSGQFMPAEYQEQLRNIISPDAMPEQSRHAIEDMKTTLSATFIESSTGMIILELLEMEPDEQQTGHMTATLIDLASYLLETGDFAALTAIYDRLMRQNPCSSPGNQSAYAKIAGAFIEPVFLDKVLDGLDFWGKTKFNEIGILIKKIGIPFVDPLLNHLADAPKISARRYYMARLKALGAAAREALLARLDDGRWYFVRNVIILLRATNDNSTLPAIRKLAFHPHTKVRQEAFTTLLHFSDPEADRLLQQDMLSKDKTICLTAIKLAGKSSNTETCRILFRFIGKTGFTNFEMERKSAVIQALAEIGNTEALPVLGKLFRSKNILRPIKHFQLKQEIVRSLSRYPVASVNQALKKIVRSSPRELSQLAREILDNFGEKGE